MSDDSTSVDIHDIEVLDVVPTNDRQPWMCEAHLRDGSGELCRKPRMMGQTICASHGGQAPQNIEAAWKRIRAWTDPVLAQLIDTALAPSGFCETCGRQADALRLRAQIAVVDRALDARVPVEAPTKEAAFGSVRRIIVDAWESLLTDDERAQVDALRTRAVARVEGHQLADAPSEPAPDDDTFIV